MDMEISSIDEKQERNETNCTNHTDCEKIVLGHYKVRLFFAILSFLLHVACFLLKFRIGFRLRERVGVISTDTKRL